MNHDALAGQFDASTISQHMPTSDPMMSPRVEDAGSQFLSKAAILQGKVLSVQAAHLVPKCVYVWAQTMFDTGL